MRRGGEKLLWAQRLVGSARGLGLLGLVVAMVGCASQPKGESTTIQLVMPAVEYVE